MEEKINYEIEFSGIEEASKKAVKLIALLKEAKSLSNEIASMEFKILGKIKS